MTNDELWIDVTPADIREARDEFRAARDRRDPDETPERIAALRERMELLWRIEARQIIRDFHRTGFMAPADQSDSAER